MKFRNLMNKIYECKECGREESILYNCCPGCSAYGSYKELEQTTQQTPIEKMIEEKNSSKLYCSECKKEHKDEKTMFDDVVYNTKTSRCCDATLCDGRNF